ncbi:MAG: CheY-like chemotaxis protein, partial [Myxococcota bacterium]
CRTAVLSLQGTAEQAGLSLRLEVDDPGEDLLIAPVRLRQIVLNLLSNAIKFTPEGEVVVRAQLRSGELLLEVSDTGIGIAEENHAAIFERFSQVEQGSRRAFSGAGLGLSICRELAARMGGTLTLDSRLGEGSTFTLRCPVACVPSAADEAPPPPITAVLPVLLVEDHPVNQTITAALLRRMGCTVVIAEHGQAAVERAAAEPFALILMDCMMPVMDGYEAAAQIRRSGANQDTPILALTANSQPEDRQRILAAGMDEHLTKPISRAALQRALARWQ